MPSVRVGGGVSDQAASRSAQLDRVEDHTGQMRGHAGNFHEGATRLRRQHENAPLNRAGRVVSKLLGLGGRTRSDSTSSSGSSQSESAGSPRLVPEDGGEFSQTRRRRVAPDAQALPEHNGQLDEFFSASVAVHPRIASSGGISGANVALISLFAIGLIATCIGAAGFDEAGCTAMFDGCAEAGYATFGIGLGFMAIPLGIGLCATLTQPDE